MIDRDRAVGFVFSDIARFRGITFDQLMQSFGLTHAQAYILNHLFHQDGLTQVQLAERMDIGTVTVSGLVDRLEARGWLERKTDKMDRRAKQVWLTPASDVILAEMEKQFQQLNDISLAGLDDSEIEVLVELLGKVKSNLRETLGRR